MKAEASHGGLLARGADETVQIEACGEGIFHVSARPTASSSVSGPEPWIQNPCSRSASRFSETGGHARLQNGSITASIELATGAIRVEDAAGKVLLQEGTLRPRRYTPVSYGGQKFYKVTDSFSPEIREGFYGLGQHQGGVLNYRGSEIELAQVNSDIAVPLLLSTNGYGILWNTASRTRFDNRFAHEMMLSADCSAGIDYYFFYGPDFDAVIHHYRDLTGHAPLFGRWAYGFIQSKDRYTSAQELLDVAGKYRAEHVPLDVIVQDWFWWKTQGDPEFSQKYLQPNPDVPGAIRTLHEENVHTILSTWAVLDPASDAYKQMLTQHLLIPGTPDYDATNSAARDFYWDHLIGKLFAQGWDGFWLDSSEPETWKGESNAVLEDRQLSIGPGAEYLNVFPLLHTGNVYDHWRRATDRKRVFLLTRSAFAGQQRNATVEWSGDVFGTFPTLRRQITAGLNFALSGMPYWTTDIAGYTSPFTDEPNNPEYQELYTRWFEFGTFCPILRTHGHRSSNELFSYGAQTPTLIAYDKLRSRLLPYTYSLAWKVTHDDHTMPRPHVMDWRTEEKVRDIGDEFMFGPSFLVSPVTKAGISTRTVYLPPAKGWYDFWTGERTGGDQQIETNAPLNRIPVYVKAGSIVPLGPASEFAEASSGAPVELRIYSGADADFELYNDSGDSYDYEKGQHATIRMHWDDASRTLALGSRAGSFPGMKPSITFRVALAASGVGASPDAATAFKEIVYSGKDLKVHLP